MGVWSGGLAEFMEMAFGVGGVEVNGVDCSRCRLCRGRRAVELGVSFWAGFAVLRFLSRGGVFGEGWLSLFPFVMVLALGEGVPSSRWGENRADSWSVSC